MPRKFKKIYVLLVGGLLVPFSIAHAQLEFDPASNYNPGGDITTINRVTFLSAGEDPLSISLNLINLSLTFLGTISLLLMLYAGILWFRAGADEEKVTKAKQIIIGSVIGIAITLTSYGIAQLLFYFLYESASGNYGG